MYSRDSFFNLSVPGQMGLLAISTALAMVMLGACWYLTKGRRSPVRLAMGATLFFVFEWFSPQIYYTYYILLFDVPWQVVIGTPPSFIQLVQLLTFSGDMTLSFHSRGLLGWAMLLAAALRPWLIKESGNGSAV